MKMGVMTIGAVVLAATSVGWAQTAPKLPSDYDVLTRKSIFSRDRVVRPQDGSGNWKKNRPRYTQPVRNYTPILIGAMVEDDGYFVAFIADPATGLLTSFRTGDTLPMNAGTIKEITLDNITTVGADHGTHKIDIGENILGGAAEYPSAEASAAPSAETATTGPAGDGNGDENAGPGGEDNGPPAPSADSSTSSTVTPPSIGAGGGGNARLPGESLLDYLRRRRAEQLKK
jgi:hypothetical protein